MSEELPGEPETFWNSPKLAELPEAPKPPESSAMERLGPSPFPRDKFPFLGFLASVYDHVAEVISGRGRRE